MTSYHLLMFGLKFFEACDRVNVGTAVLSFTARSGMLASGRLNQLEGPGCDSDPPKEPLT